MARKPSMSTDSTVQSYRHDATRKNIPPAGLAAQGHIKETPKIKYSYDPHLPPVLRFDPTGVADALPELLAEATRRALTSDEARTLAAALRHQQPWLEWAGKREQKLLEVDPVALHIHERVSAQAILAVAKKENVQRSLFADPEQEYREAVQFYQHEVDWSNRLILGDSLQVMASLARREDLAGQVQMIYLDPPYGIKFASNFQSMIGNRDVKDKESDLTREPEMVKAYRDTWTLGVHSYLAYLRDRLVLCRELLKDTGSIFVQISDENLHRVRSILDEVFGVDNFCRLITIKKTAGDPTKLLTSQADYILWYARDKNLVKYRPLFLEKEVGSGTGEQYDRLYDNTIGSHRRISPEEAESPSKIPSSLKPFRTADLRQRGFSPNAANEVEVEGRSFFCGYNYHWKTNADGLRRLRDSDRLHIVGNTLEYRRYYEDWSVTELTNIWMDAGGSGFADPKLYVVQTVTRVIQRCMLMTTDPGDLVLDPTCGSGTTANVAEQWGRRWITIDTSRVALALARQRLLTATFPMYKVKSSSDSEDAPNPGNGFLYKTVPHITLKSIAQNVVLDAIFARHQPFLDERLRTLNAALAQVPNELRTRLKLKLPEKEQREGKKSLTDADRRRWLLSKETWQEWEVPFDTDDEWPVMLRDTLTAYRVAWRAKMDEVNAAITASAEQEKLVDLPEPVKGVIRVAGPFTVEAVMPAIESLDVDSPIGGAPDELETFGDGAVVANEAVNAEAYLDRMLRLLHTDGVRFPNNKMLRFDRLDPLPGATALHAEGEWTSDDGETRRVAVSIGPEHGPVTTMQVEEALRQAHRRREFDDLVFAGFSFDSMAQAAIQDDPNPRVRCHLAHIRPDVNMGGLLKETPNSQLFTVFGLPRTELRRTDDGQYEVEMQGVDIYNPVDNTLLPTGAEKVAAWFIDSDYDGQTFCITQAFFPDKTAWEKLARALKGIVDEDRFAALSGTVSLPFPAGRHQCVAVKVIDPRGNEVMRIHRFDTPVRY